MGKSSVDKVIVPLGKTVTFSFEIDGKKVEVANSEYVDKSIEQPAFISASASLNQGSFTAPATVPVIASPSMYSPSYTDYGAGLVAIKFTSKNVSIGKPGANSNCSFLYNGNEVLNNTDPKNPLPYHYLPRYPSAKVIQWSVVNVPPAGTATTLTPKIPSADKGELSFTGSGTVMPTYYLEVTVLLQLQIEWPEEFPPFVSDNSGDIGWKSDFEGRLSLATFYALYNELPDTVKNDVQHVRFKRRVIDPKQGGHMNQYWWEIVLQNDNIAPNPPATGGTPPRGNRSSVAHHFLHEMAHASTFARAGNGWVQINLGVLAFLTEFGSLATLSLVSAAAAGAAVCTVVPAIVAVVALEWAQASIAMRRDFVSEWSAESDWRCNHFGWHAIPIIGHFISIFHKTEPNIFFGADTCMRGYFGLENIELTKQGQDWAKAGMVSDYAATCPLEDFADSFASYIMTDAFLRAARGYDSVAKRNHRLKLAEGSGNRAKFLKKTYYPDGVKEMAEVITQKYEEFDFDIETHRKAKLKTQGAPDNEMLKAFAILGKMQEEWDNGPGPLFERNREIMAKLAVPVRQNPTPLEMLRTLELHGDGWKLYEGKEQPVEKGDLVADAAQQTWMISVTDEQKKLQQVAGGFTYRKGMKPEELVKEHTHFKLTWSPASEKRDWLSGGQKASPHYKDLDAVFTHMIRLWGEQKAESGRMMNSCKEFLHEWLHTAEMWNTSYPFSTEPDIREAMNYLESHGKGLQVLEPSIIVAPGDLLIPYHCSSVGMVTRVNKDNKTIDMLESGTFDKGMLGEAAEAARMRYGIPLSEFQYYWAPSPEPRQLI